MAEFNDTTSFLNKTNQIRNERQIPSQSVEEKNNMSYSVLNTKQNKITTDRIPSTSETKNTNNEDDCELIVHLTGLGNSEGSDHCSLSSCKGSETNSHLICGGNFQFFKKKAFKSFNMLKSMYNHKQQPITLKHVNILKKMMLSTVSPSNLKITLGFNSKMLDPMDFYRNDKKPGLFTGEYSESNHVCVDFKRGNSSDSLLTVKQYNQINDLSLEQDSTQKHLKLFQGLSLGTSSIELGSVETHDAAGTVCGSQELNPHVIQFYDPTITSRCINSISNIICSNENKVNRGYKFDNTLVGQLLPSINVGTHKMLESQVINNVPALSGNVFGENNIDCNDVVNICISEHTSTEKSNDFTKNNQPLPIDFFDFNRINCSAEISKKCTYPISKIKVYAEIETTNSPLKIFHTLLNHEGDNKSSVVRNFKRNICLASTSTDFESINTLSQEMFCTNMEEISAKIKYNQSQTFQHEQDESAISILNLGHDLNGEVNVLSKNINSKFENFKEQDLNHNVSDEFDSNNSSPLNISIREEIANAISVLDSNIENENFEINKGEPLDRIWNDSEIDEAINDSIEKYVNTTTDKCILATPSISEKMCQTDISSFNINSCKRFIKFDDDGGPLKKSKLPYKTELSKDVSTSAELFSAEGIKIAEELLNTEEFAIMNNKEICWSPEMPSENRAMPVIYQEEENDTNEVNNDNSLFDEEEMEDGRLNWSKSTSESEAIDWDQLVPLPHQQIKSDKMEENDPVTEEGSGLSGSGINQDYMQPSTSTCNYTAPKCRYYWDYIPFLTSSYNDSSEDSSD